MGTLLVCVSVAVEAERSGRMLRLSPFPLRRSTPAPAAQPSLADLLVDTDVCIDHLAGVRRLHRKGRRLACSVITRAELLVGAGEDEADIRRFLAGLDELPVDRRVADRAGVLRRDIRSLRMPDALIAATALVHALTLDTRTSVSFVEYPASG